MFPKSCYPHCYSRRHLLLGGAALLAPRAWAADTLRVGPDQAIKTLAEAARQAHDGSVIEVQAGDYAADVATWPQNDLSLRAVGGRVRLLANGASSQGKGIFVMAGQRQRIEGFDFIGCVVPDGNGAGIRLERGSLALRDCRFANNENGLLSSNDGTVELDIEDCEFGTIQKRQGQTHNLYVGAIARLSVRGSSFHTGMLGHLLKSRAKENHIICNWLVDGPGGMASYELELPNGGLAYVVGNVIEKGPQAQNPHLLSYGVEGQRWERNELLMAHNTLVDRRGSSIWLRAAPWAGRVQFANLLLAGNPYVGDQGLWGQWDAAHGNFVVDANAFAPGGYALKGNSSLRGKAVPVEDAELALTLQFHAPFGTTGLRGRPRNPGAIQ